MFKNVKFGADPEMFIKNSDGTFIASCGKIGGTKEEPMPLGVGAVQEDNVSVEFNIPPSITKVEFVNNLSAVISEIEEKFIHPMGCELSIVPSAIFSQEELAHPAAQVFGCDPDFNVYTKESNPRPEGIQGLVISFAFHNQHGITILFFLLIWVPLLIFRGEKPQKQKDTMWNPAVI